jgi:DnaJ-class molecular chaperone
MDMSVDYYKILGVIDSAETAVIKAAYKALVQIYHPDKFAGGREEAIRKTQRLNEAFEILSDPEKRRLYDAQRASNKSEYRSEEDVESSQQSAMDGLLETK